MNRFLLTLVMTATAALASGCELFNRAHEVGECVNTLATFSGTEITSAECPASGTFAGLGGEPVYRITAVLDIGQSCPTGSGYGGIELTHEPDDVVYCLEMVV